MNNTLEDRLDELRGNESIAAFAKMCDIQENTMRLYFSGSIPSLDKAQKIARNCGVSLEWLATGEGVKSNKDNLKMDFGAVKIKVFDVSLSAGYGCSVDNEQVLFNFMISKEMAEKLDLSPQCIGAYISGDSMTPRLNSGDIAVIDRQITQLENDGIYAFNFNGHCYIKQLQKIGKSIKVKSLNPDYESWSMDIEDNFNIIGKLRITIKRA